MVGVSIDTLIHYQKRHKVWRKNSMDKKGITYMKIIIPVMAAIVIIGGAIVYSTKQPKAQEVMAPIETEQSVVTESEVSEPAPQPAQPAPAPSAKPEPTEETTTPEEVTDEIVAETQDEAEYVDYVQDQASENNKDESDMEESDIEPLDKVMYATGNINTRSGPSVDFTKVGGLTVNQEVKVTGQSKTTGWYEIEVDGGKQYVSHTLLSDTKVQESKPSSNGGGNGGGSTSSGGNGGNADINARAQEAFKQLGVDPSKDISQDVAAPAPEFKHADGLEGVHAE